MAFNRIINIQLQATDNGLTAKMTKAASETNKLTQAFTNSAGGINTNTAAVEKSTAALTKQESIFTKIGKAFQGNRGLVFGFAGLTSAMAESVGMLGMQSDSATRLAEAQDELNQLTAEGTTSGKAYTDALSEVNKQQRFNNMVNRNTMLSLMDNVFFTTMAVNGLMEMNKEGGAMSGVFGKLKNAITGANRSIQTGAGNVANFMANMSPLPNVMTTTASGTTKATSAMGNMGGVMASTAGRALMLGGALAGIGVAAVGLTMLISKLEEVKNTVNEVFVDSIAKISLFSAGILQLKVSFGLASEEEKKALEQVNKAAELVKQAMENLGITSLDVITGNIELTNKLADEIVRLSQEGGTAVELLGEKYQKPISSAKAWNDMIAEGSRAVQQAAPYVMDYARFVDESGMSTEAAKAHVEEWVQRLVDGGAVSEELGDTIKMVLVKGFEDMTEAEKLAAEEAENMLEVLKQVPSVGDRVTGFMEQFANGNQQAVGWLNEVKIAVDEWATSHKNVIPELDKTGQTTKVLEKHLTDIFDDYMNLEQAQMLASIGAALFSDSQKQVKDATKDANKEIFEAADVLIKLLDEYNALSTEVGKFMQVNDLTMVQMEDMISIHGEMIGSIETQAAHIKNQATYWRDLNKEEIESGEIAMQLVQTWAMQNDRLKENQEWVFKLAQSYTLGMSEAKNWSNETVLAAKQSEGFRKNLILQNQEVLKGVPTQHMLTEEIQAFIVKAQGGADAAILYARHIEALRDSHLEFFSSLTGAEDSKAFNKAWKEMKEAFPKKDRDEWKEFFKDLQKAQESGQKAAIGLNAVSLALSGVGDAWKDMSDEDIEEAVTKAMKSFQKWAAAMDHEGHKLAQFPGFIDAVTGSSKEYEDTIRMLADAQKDLNIDSTEYLDLVNQFVQDAGGYNELSQEQIQALKDMGFEYDENTGKIEKTGQATKDWSQETLAAADSVSQIETIISSLWVFATQVYDDMSKQWSENMGELAQNAKDAAEGAKQEFEGLEKDVETITEDILNAFTDMADDILDEIEGLVRDINSELDNIEDEEVVITTVKRTVTESKAKGGFHSFAEGGFLSADRGLISTQGPAVIFGDNNGGRETAAFIPHNEPFRSEMVERVMDLVGKKEGDLNLKTEGDRIIVVPININIGDEQYSFQRKYRIRQGQEVASQVGG